MIIIDYPEYHQLNKKSRLESAGIFLYRNFGL